MKRKIIWNNSPPLVSFQNIWNIKKNRWIDILNILNILFKEPFIYNSIYSLWGLILFVNLIGLKVAQRADKALFLGVSEDVSGRD